MNTHETEQAAATRSAQELDQAMSIVELEERLEMASCTTVRCGGNCG